MIASGYYGLLRVGEIATGCHAIKAKDVHVAMNKRKILFILRTSKTHWMDVKPQQIRISSTFRNQHLAPQRNCPFQILRDYLMLWPLG